MPFSDVAVRNTIKNVMLNENWADGDEDLSSKMDVLFAESLAHCGPSFENPLTIEEYIPRDLFESLWM